LLKAAKAEFDKRTAGKTYESINVETSPPGGKMDLEHRHHFDCAIHSAMEYFGIEEPVA
jgi:aminobenzoyl-glutamate utilization protein B